MDKPEGGRKKARLTGIQKNDLILNKPGSNKNLPVMPELGQQKQRTGSITGSNGPLI